MTNNPFKNFKNPFKDVKNPFKDFKNPFKQKGRKLYRSPKDSIIFGICAGLADYLKVDPVFLRLATVVLAFFADVWPVIIAYVIAAFLVPIDPAQDTVASHQAPKDVTPEAKERMDSDQNM